MAVNECIEKAASDEMSDQEVDELLAQIDAREPMLSCDDMDKIEKQWVERRAARRCALVLMTKPFSWLREQVENDRDFALAVADVFICTKNIDYYKGMAELMEQAKLWSMMALVCREDMSDLIAEVETGNLKVDAVHP
jgi:hypothetical protein